MIPALLVCAASGAGWTAAVARGAPGGALRSAARGLLGGVVAFAAAWAGYSLAERAGMRVSWDEVTAGGSGGAATAAAIGLVEESANLLGMSVASLGSPRAGRATALRTVLAVSAAFATLECMLVLRGTTGSVLLLRAVLAPVGHAALAAPLGLVLAGGRRVVRWGPPALLLAAALHAASDLSLATPGLGRLGFAAVLAAPVVFLHLHGRLGWARGRVGGGGGTA